MLIHHDLLLQTLTSLEVLGKFSDLESRTWPHLLYEIHDLVVLLLYSDLLFLAESFVKAAMTLVEGVRDRHV